MSDDLVNFIRQLYESNQPIPLHEPSFTGNEKQYLLDAVDSTFVSSVGRFVDDFEKYVATYTGAKFAIATVNGTSALHAALISAGVASDDEVITQSLTFVATCNAIRYCNAVPVFVDVSRKTAGMDPESLEAFLNTNCEIRDDGVCWNKNTSRPVRVCMPMHSFGQPVEIKSISELCARYNITLVEDAAESLGSHYAGRHTGTYGKLGALSFNGNKIITTGGGGMVLTDSEELAINARHITTTAKVSSKWAMEHDKVAFNYRMPNINAAIGMAQMEALQKYISLKRELANSYIEWGSEQGLDFLVEEHGSSSNYWLNNVITSNIDERNILLEFTNQKGILTRPAWTPMHKLPMFRDCQSSDLSNTEWLFDRLVSLPSGIPRHWLNS